jgi:hypothetical protein
LGFGGTSDGKLGADGRIKSVPTGGEIAIESSPEKSIANSSPRRINWRADLNLSVITRLKHLETFNASSIPKVSAKDKMMKSSRAEAILLLKSWKDSGALIWCTLFTPEQLTFASWGLVKEVSDSSARLTGSRDSVVSFFFDDADFEYGEPGELEEGFKWRAAAEKGIVCLLGIGFPSGSKLFLAQSPGNVPRAE